MNISDRLSDGWVDAWTVYLLVVELRVQQGETFMVSNIPLFSRDRLILEQKSLSCSQIIPVSIFSGLGAYLLPFPSLLDASLCLSSRHPPEASSAVIPQVPQRN